MTVTERFINYAKIHTTSDPDSGLHPSFSGEFSLAELLKSELAELGLSDIRLDEHCYVYAKLPAACGYENAPALGLIAHMDTSSEASGENVKPQLHHNYDGDTVELTPEGQISPVRMLSPERFPFLRSLKGQTLITSDGTTLIGADDKAGIAEIMSALSGIIEGGLPHGPLSIAFTPDEEIGEGSEFFDIEGFGADFAYTVDGGDIDAIEYENFNAASADIIFRGQSVHPGDAKGIMVNASKLAMEFQLMLPENACPECTEGREGFYHLTDMSGNVSKAELHYLIRNHDRAEFEEMKYFLTEAAGKMNRKYGEGTAECTVKDSYYNMKEMIIPHFHLVENARAAISMEFLVPKDVPVRGGTDGARLSFMGLPCPNLGTGGYNFHGEYECITSERMEAAVRIIKNIISIYSRA